MKSSILLLTAICLLVACTKEPTPVDPPVDPSTSYFYPTGGDPWESMDAHSLGWDTASLGALDSLLKNNGTRALIMLYKGRIVHERYWGKNVLGTGDFNAASQWYWASAGKTLTAFLCGLAGDDGHMDLEQPVSDHLGSGWTSMADSLERRIRIRHQLSMTTGLDHTVPDLDCTDPACLQYKNEAGTVWFYHNAPYTLMESVIASASGVDYNSYTDQKLQGPIGMNGTWIKAGYNNIYWSTARDAARFGLLMLSKGKWDGASILKDSGYFHAMTHTSQEINRSYGYLTWLNGQGSVVMPGFTVPIQTSLAPSAPADLFAAMGKNGQFIDVVPSKDLVVVRMGDAPDPSTVPVLFHDHMWQSIQAVLP